MPKNEKEFVFPQKNVRRILTVSEKNHKMKLHRRKFKLCRTRRKNREKKTQRNSRT